MSSVSPAKMSLSSLDTNVQPIPEKLPDVISTYDVPTGNITSYSNLVSGQAEKGSEKSDIELSNERPLMNVQQETAEKEQLYQLQENYINSLTENIEVQFAGSSPIFAALKILDPQVCQKAVNRV